MKYLSITIFIVTLLLLPLSNLEFAGKKVLAQNTNGQIETFKPTDLIPPSDGANGVFSPGSGMEGVGRIFSQPSDIISALFRLVITVAGVIFLILFLVSGVQYLTSAGNEDGTGKAKKRMIDSVIGLIIVLSAWAVGNWTLRAFGYNLPGIEQNRGTVESPRTSLQVGESNKLSEGSEVRELTEAEKIELDKERQFKELLLSMYNVIDDGQAGYEETRFQEACEYVYGINSRVEKSDGGRSVCIEVRGED